MSRLSGKLRHFVMFEALTVDLDSDGRQVETWADAFGLLIQAEILPLSGRELIAAGATQAKATGRMVIRYRPGITESMRITHRGTIYNIEGIIPDAGSGTGWMTLLTSTGVNEG